MFIICQDTGKSRDCKIYRTKQIRTNEKNMSINAILFKTAKNKQI